MLMPPGGRAHRRIQMLREILGMFGLSVNEAKSDFVLRDRHEHLGLVIDLKKRAFSLSFNKV